MVERIPQHRHCDNCEKAVPIDRDYCDENCEKTHKDTLKAKKRQLQTFYFIMVLIFIFAVVLSIF